MHLINNLAMAIKTASAEKDFLGIRKIWEERFTTDPIYLNTIFEKVFPLCRSYVFSGGEGEILSVISLMPMKFYAPEISGTASDGYLKGYYLFGVATLEKATGNHLAAALIEYASRQLAIEGYDFIFERPANQSLNNYYIKLGFLKSLPKIPYRFAIEEITGSTENNHRKPLTKSLAEAVLKAIRIDFCKRFEWADTAVLEGLLELGELSEHNKNYTPTPTEEETYIAIKVLSEEKPDTFTGAFFCFPME